MPTQQQIEANRRNAQKSTGPKTPEGRAAVRHNSIKHGLTASALVLPGECQADFEAFLDSVEAEYQPTTPTEAALVRRIAMANWRLTRYFHIEAGFFVVRHMDLQKDFEKYTNLDPGDRLAIIVRDDNNGSKTLTNLSCYGSRLERSMDKARRTRAFALNTFQRNEKAKPIHGPSARSGSRFSPGLSGNCAASPELLKCQRARCQPLQPRLTTCIME